MRSEQKKRGEADADQLDTIFYFAPLDSGRAFYCVKTQFESDRLMDFIKDYGPDVAVTIVGVLIGGIALGAVLYYGDRNDVGFLKTAHRGLGG